MKARITSVEADRVNAVLHRHVGAAFVISRDNLAEQAGLSDRKVRQAVHELIVNRGVPVASSPSGGYFICSTQAELEEAVHFIESYRDEHAQRARCLREAFARLAAEQLYLAV